MAPGCERINQLRITNAAYLSQWKGESVKIPCDEAEYDRFLAKMQSESQPKAADWEKQKTNESYSERWQVKF